MILRTYDTDHVALVWNFSPDEDEDYMKWYPGDEVDWWCVNVFNPQHMNRRFDHRFCGRCLRTAFPCDDR